MEVIYRGKPGERLQPLRLPDGSVIFVAVHPEYVVKLIDTNGKTVAMLMRDLSK